MTTIAKWADSVVLMTSPVVRQQEVAKYALTTLAATQLTNRATLGFLPAVVTKVDGRVALATIAALAAVKLAGGIIEFTFRDNEDVIKWIATTLHDNSPFVSGEYQRDNLLLADGAVVDPFGPLPTAREFTFISAAPYARKIERGESSQAPHGVYQVTATLAARRFSDRNVSIAFGWRPLSEGAVDEWAGTSSARRLAAHTRGGNSAKHHDWLTRQPSISVRF